MSRKTPSFGQLIKYIEREEGNERYRIRHNVYGRDPDRIRVEFEENGELPIKRCNANYLYHEIISITPAEGLSAEAHKLRLQQIAEDYVSARCPDCMVFGGLHADKEHSYHYHLMISANAVGEKKRTFLSKAQFREIQVRTEDHVLAQYPELQQGRVIGKQSAERQNERAFQTKRRSGGLSKKEAIRERVHAAWSRSHDRESFMQELSQAGFDLNLKKSLSVTDRETGLHHRLKTLDPELLVLAEKTLNTERSKAQSSERDENYERADADLGKEAHRRSAGEKEKAQAGRDGGSESRADTDDASSRTQDDDLKGAKNFSEDELRQDDLSRTQSSWRDEIRERRIVEQERERTREKYRDRDRDR